VLQQQGELIEPAIDPKNDRTSNGSSDSDIGRDNPKDHLYSQFLQFFLSGKMLKLLGDCGQLLNDTFLGLRRPR